jgi:hypothetical protein
VERRGAFELGQVCNHRQPCVERRPVGRSLVPGEQPGEPETGAAPAVDERRECLLCAGGLVHVHAPTYSLRFSV